MKRRILILITFCVVLTLFTPHYLIAQKKNETAVVAGAALLGGLIATKLAVEEIKEQLEQDAVTHILTSHPEIKNFRLKCFFESGEKWSDESGTSLLTFKITVLNKSKKTSDRKVLLRFNNNNFVNENGIRINKIEYKLIDANEWNSMMAFFGNLLSVGDSILPKDNDSLNNFDKYYLPMYKSSKCSVYGSIKSEYYNLMGDEREVCFVKTGYTIPLSSIKFVKNAFESPRLNESEYTYPFYRLKGDDYLVGDYSSRIKIFANENSMGLFLKKIGKTILIRKYIIGEIHSFLNFQDIISNNFQSFTNTNDTLNLKSKIAGLYYNGKLCYVIDEISDTEVKIKYLTETGRGYHKKIVNIDKLEEIKEIE